MTAVNIICMHSMNRCSELMLLLDPIAPRRHTNSVFVAKEVVSRRSGSAKIIDCPTGQGLRYIKAELYVRSSKQQNDFARQTTHGGDDVGDNGFHVHHESLVGFDVPLEKYCAATASKRGEREG